jgi:serine/threonine protein kinase
MHRDLTHSNILLNERFEPIISCFGLAKFWQSDVIHTMHIGTPLFMAPELFSDEYVDNYANTIDIYAYGICLLLLFAKELKFSSGTPWKSIQQFLFRVGKGERFMRPDGMNDFLWRLVNRCWDAKVENRPSFSEIVEELRSHRSEYAIEGTNLVELEAYENRILRFDSE